MGLTVDQQNAILAAGAKADARAMEEFADALAEIEALTADVVKRRDEEVEGLEVGVRLIRARYRYEVAELHERIKATYEARRQRRDELYEQLVAALPDSPGVRSAAIGGRTR